MAEAKTHEYEQTCSRCDGSGDDPEISNCMCDCCDGTGMETLTLTEAEAVNYPHAKIRRADGGGARG